MLAEIERHRPHQREPQRILRHHAQYQAAPGVGMHRIGDGGHRNRQQASLRVDLELVGEADKGVAEVVLHRHLGHCHRRTRHAAVQQRDGEVVEVRRQHAVTQAADRQLHRRRHFLGVVEDQLQREGCPRGGLHAGFGQCRRRHDGLDVDRACRHREPGLAVTIGTGHVLAVHEQVDTRTRRWPFAARHGVIKGEHADRERRRADRNLAVDALAELRHRFGDDLLAPGGNTLGGVAVEQVAQRVQLAVGDVELLVFPVPAPGIVQLGAQLLAVAVAVDLGRNGHTGHVVLRFATVCGRRGEVGRR